MAKKCESETEIDPKARESKYIRPLLLAIIGTLLVLYGIKPLFDLLLYLTLSFGEKYHISFVDSIYKAAARGHNNSVSTSILVFILGFVVIFSFFAVVFVTRVIFEREKPKKKKTQSRRKLRLLYIMVILSFLVLVGNIVLLLTKEITQVQVGISFRQRFTVLEPAIDEATVKELRASWASMSSRNDYKKIVKRMESIAEQKKIKLPPLLLK